MPIQLPDPIIIKKRVDKDVQLHTFVAAFTEDNIANATHIIESRDVLVLIDSQFLAPYATLFRAYADSLGKRIERMYISHRHPDHWFGLGTAFGDIPIYALQETIDFIRESGEASREDHLKTLGDLAPKTIIIPQKVARCGMEPINDVEYAFERVVDTEIDFLLTIRLPDLKVSIPQDLIYSGTHLYLTENFDNWIRVLQKMLTSDDEFFLPGHGFPAGKDEVARNLEYLCAAKAAMATGLTKSYFKQYLLARYPERKCPAILDIYLPRLFDDASQF